MAEIPVERKEGFPWWLLLVGALLLGLLLWMFMASDNDDTVVADADYDDTTYVAATAVNSAVSMDDALVTRLTGDMSFYAENDMGEEYFIVFDEVPTPGTAKEGLLDINVGNRVDIDGYIRDRNYALPATVDATIPSGLETFVYATSIDKD